MKAAYKFCAFLCAVRAERRGRGGVLGKQNAPHFAARMSHFGRGRVYLSAFTYFTAFSAAIAPSAAAVTT